MSAPHRHHAVIKQFSPIITALQNYTISIWQSRNTVLHETGSYGQAALHAQLNLSITQFYGLRDTFSPILQSYFTTPLEIRLRSSPRQRARWLTLVKLASSHASSQGSRQTLVSHYFAYATPADGNRNPTVRGPPVTGPTAHATATVGYIHTDTTATATVTATAANFPTPVIPDGPAPPAH